MFPFNLPLQGNGPEIKIVDQQAVAFIDGTGVIINTNNTAQGSSIGGRIANQTHAVSVTWQGTFIADTASVQPQEVRLVWFVDRQPRAGVPGHGDVFSNPLSITCFPNPAGRDRFELLYDRRWVLGAKGVGPVNAPVAPIVIAIRGHIDLDFTVLYNAVSPGMESNALYYRCWSSAGNLLPFMVIESRFQFTDA